MRRSVTPLGIKMLDIKTRVRINADNIVLYNLASVFTLIPFSSRRSCIYFNVFFRFTLEISGKKLG